MLDMNANAKMYAPGGGICIVIRGESAEKSEGFAAPAQAPTTEEDEWEPDQGEGVDIKEISSDEETVEAKED